MMSCEWWGSVWANVLGGVITSTIVGSVAYLLARMPNLSGVWTMHVDILDSDYNPYKGMKLTYIVMLSQSSGSLQGVAEKVHEVSKKNPLPGYHYQRAGRMHSTISGGIFGNVFQQKKFQLILHEEGEHRRYVSIADVEVQNDNSLKGSYTSTAANSRGTVTLTRGIGNYGFSPETKR